jgi:hypothetical protein
MPLWREVADLVEVQIRECSVVAIVKPSGRWMVQATSMRPDAAREAREVDPFRTVELQRLAGLAVLEVSGSTPMPNRFDPLAASRATSPNRP